MKLLVVESPAKAKTINRYLGKDFVVEATMGHIKDLPKSGLNVDVDKGYEATYKIIEGKNKVVSKIKKALPKKDEDIYLALDPDREGEAIAAHVAEVFKIKDPNRVVFYEITEEAIKSAIENPQKINTNLVEAQKARRVLDRLVGYKLSGLLWKKIWYGLSAGRVQSVATRLIVEREREIQSFVPEEFWELIAHLSKQSTKFDAKLVKKNGKKYCPTNKKETDELLGLLKKSKWIISDFAKKEKSQNPPAPFTTSTLQQSANNSLGYGTKRTMQIAQQLYQGIRIKGQGNVGLITYMRTDSLNLSGQAVDAMRKYVKAVFGDKYVPEKPRFYKTKSKLAQEAHEAIRPTHFELSPDVVKDSLKPDQFKLYKLIWDRAIASQMAPMRFFSIGITVDAVVSDKESYQFAVDEKQMVFDGFSKVWKIMMFNQSSNLERFDNFSKGDNLTLDKIDSEQKYTKPKVRYTEATLVRALEKHGIGRPSTYATIISTIQARGYVDREGRYLFPTDTGFVVNDFLVEHFKDVVDYDFTSSVEDDLDLIAIGEKQLVPVIDKVYKPLIENIEKKEKQINKNDIVVLGDSKEKCPECGGKMIIKLGRNGKFLSCAKFPDCKGILSLNGGINDEKLDMDKYENLDKCDKCESKMVLKHGKYGKFWACEKYPECKNTKPLLLKEKCPECGKNLVEKKGRWGKSFIGCSGYPECKYIKKENKKSSK